MDTIKVRGKLKKDVIEVGDEVAVRDTYACDFCRGKKVFVKRIEKYGVFPYKCEVEGEGEEIFSRKALILIKKPSSSNPKRKARLISKG